MIDVTFHFKEGPRLRLERVEHADFNSETTTLLNGQVLYENSDTGWPFKIITIDMSTVKYDVVWRDDREAEEGADQ